ncbi:hypothetical protein J7L09_02290 [bacterium]|nr:hypothetical protein [bacterium]
MGETPPSFTPDEKSEKLLRRQQEIKAIAETAEFHGRIPSHETPTTRIILEIFSRNHWSAFWILGNEIKGQNPAARNIDIETPSLEELLSDRLRQKPLIDLGCGKNLYYSLKLAEYVQASEYIGVDRFHKPETRGFLTPEQEEELETTGQTEKGNLKIRTIQEDMLVLLSQLPDNYGNLMINQIDEFILNLATGPTTNQKYLELLIEEIKRVIGAKSITFGLHSKIIFDKLKKAELTVSEHPSTVLVASATPIPNFPDKEKIKEEARKKLASRNKN